MDKISIIIPCYNAEKTLIRSLNSVREQDYSDLEVIVINDGSTDNTLSILNRYKEIDNRFIVINSQHGGVASARNQGINTCTGKYVTFLDADDNYTSPYSISTMMKAIKKGFNADMCVCNFDSIYLNSYYRNRTYYLNKPSDMKQFFQQDVTVVWNKLIKRSCITELFKTDLNKFEDKPFVLNNLKNMKKVVTISDSLINYSAFSNKYANLEKCKNLKNHTSINYINEAIDNLNSRFLKSIAKCDIKKELNFYYQNNMFLTLLSILYFGGSSKEELFEFCKISLEQLAKILPQNGLKMHNLTNEKLNLFIKLISYAFDEIKTYNKDLSTYLVACFIMSKVLFKVNGRLDYADMLTLPYQRKLIKEVTYVKNLLQLNDLDLI